MKTINRFLLISLIISTAQPISADWLSDAANKVKDAGNTAGRGLKNAGNTAFGGLKDASGKAIDWAKDNPKITMGLAVTAAVAIAVAAGYLVNEKKTTLALNKAFSCAFKEGKKGVNYLVVAKESLNIIMSDDKNLALIELAHKPGLAGDTVEKVKAVIKCYKEQK